ncbi:hypothetical protein A2G07_10985 [Deinococcus radiodurans R1 = ATCC 13939 = DSM 20539]|nr:hypothetical protein A2G07_10985 [Deinococcus radiodurans R1 = ATCC 13939 = DSM 20539]
MFKAANLYILIRDVRNVDAEQASGLFRQGEFIYLTCLIFLAPKSLQEGQNRSFIALAAELAQRVYSVSQTRLAQADFYQSLWTLWQLKNPGICRGDDVHPR